MGTKLKSTQWHLIVTLTRDIVMPCGTTMPRVTQGTWHVAFLFFFKKN